MPDWFEGLPQDLTVDVEANGTTQKVPLREHSFVKESPDLGHFVNKAFQAHRELGSRLPIKKLEKPEEVVAWRKEFLPKLYSNGLLDGPPADEAGYELKPWEDPPPGVTWSEENVKKFASLGLKYGIPKAGIHEFLELHRQAVTGVQKNLDTSYEAGVTALKREFGDQYDNVMELCRRFTPTIFKTEQEVAFFNETGIANHPIFLSVIARLAQRAQGDTSFGLENNNNNTTASHDELKKELADIMGNPNNPDYKGYWAGDAAIQKKINDKYAKLFPGQVTIS